MSHVAHIFRSISGWSCCHGFPRIGFVFVFELHTAKYSCLRSPTGNEATASTDMELALSMTSSVHDDAKWFHNVITGSSQTVYTPTLKLFKPFQIHVSNISNLFTLFQTTHFKPFQIAHFKHFNPFQTHFKPSFSIPSNLSNPFQTLLKPSQTLQTLFKPFLTPRPPFSCRIYTYVPRLGEV